MRRAGVGSGQSGTAQAKQMNGRRVDGTIIGLFGGGAGDGRAPPRQLAQPVAACYPRRTFAERVKPVRVCVRVEKPTII